MPAYKSQEGHTRLGATQYGGKSPLPGVELQVQLEYVATLEPVDGFKIVRGSWSPLSRTRWYVAKPLRRGWEFAPGCPKDFGATVGGFEGLEAAIACLEALR
jgi:hypothetical protein